MGCFLVITEKDFGQLSKTMKAGVSVIARTSDGKVKIQVNPTMQHSARQMAALMRKHASSARATSATPKEASRAIPTKERIEQTVTSLSAVNVGLVAVYMELLRSQVRSVQPIVNMDVGKAGEEVAARILKHTGYLVGDVKGTKAQGYDLLGRNRVGNTVIVEVKTSVSNKPFGERLYTELYKEHDKEGIGFRQASDGWIKAVNKRQNADVDLSNVTVLGVHVDPIKDRVTIYRRVDSDASQWKSLMTMSLAEYGA